MAKRKPTSWEVVQTFQNTPVYVPDPDAYGSKKKLVEARIASYMSMTRRYELRFRDKKGKWRLRTGWIFSEVYLSAEHYRRHQKRLRARDALASIERLALNAVLNCVDRNFELDPEAQQLLVETQDARKALEVAELREYEAGQALPHMRKPKRRA